MAAADKASVILVDDLPNVPMRNIELTLQAYDRTDFSGLADAARASTVQGALADVLEELTQRRG